MPLLKSNSDEAEKASIEIFGHDSSFVRQVLSGEKELPFPERSSYDKKAFLSVCKRLGLDVPRDFFNSMEADHIVEIFDIEGRSVFKNLQYFQFSNYSIDDHLSKSFLELFSRPAEIEKQITSYLMQAFSDKDYALKQPQIPYHYLKEKHSSNRSIFGLDIKTFQLVKTKDTKELCGFATMTKVTEFNLASNV